MSNKIDIRLGQILSRLDHLESKLQELIDAMNNYSMPQEDVDRLMMKGMEMAEHRKLTAGLTVKQRNDA